MNDIIYNLVQPKAQKPLHEIIEESNDILELSKNKNIIKSKLGKPLNHLAFKTKALFS